MANIDNVSNEVKLAQYEKITEIIARWTKDLGEQTEYCYLREIEDVLENPQWFERDLIQEYKQFMSRGNHGK